MKRPGAFGCGVGGLLPASGTSVLDSSMIGREMTCMAVESDELRTQDERLRAASTTLTAQCNSSMTRTRWSSTVGSKSSVG